jgi:hypothetical protein
MSRSMEFLRNGLKQMKDVQPQDHLSPVIAREPRMSHLSHR